VTDAQSCNTAFHADLRLLGCNTGIAQTVDADGIPRTLNFAMTPRSSSAARTECLRSSKPMLILPMIADQLHTLSLELAHFGVMVGVFFLMPHEFCPQRCYTLLYSVFDASRRPPRLRLAIHAGAAKRKDRIITVLQMNKA
jgi:hypothetical protein